ncbi:hypothetical protein C1I98_23700 [Spongiactinospora gelatinilytica]|uniref:Uncharacterized protein n=1 Tax=Spongiactinospora gelatinilytica TaxID=2666298 RepID=A0A2W2FTG9_9ACTN|nr:hypothetical protein C1I98_23700 [Spongiactinospora gelatinilytica]
MGRTHSPPGCTTLHTLTLTPPVAGKSLVPWSWYCQRLFRGGRQMALLAAGPFAGAGSVPAVAVEVATGPTAAARAATMATRVKASEDWPCAHSRSVLWK